MSILDRIVEKTQQRVARAMEEVPFEVVTAEAIGAEPARDFFAAVTGRAEAAGCAVIAEIKRRSPSAGLIREDFDPVDIAGRYHTAGAAAISCLTEPDFFGGDLALIERIKSAVPVPVLCKNFIIDPYQVCEARAAGADAVLLISECLSAEDVERFIGIAETLGMTTLLETHTEANLRSAVELLDRIKPERVLLGINNRDLATMKTDLSHTLRLARSVADPHLVVSESGIKTCEDLAKLRRVGVRMALVGESLMRQPDPGAALRTLLGESSESHPNTAPA